MTTAATIASELILDASGFDKGMKNAEKSIGNFESRMKDLGSKMSKFGATMTLSMTVPIVAFGKAAVDSALQAEMALTELETVIKSTGGIAGVTADEVADMANKLQGITMFGDEQIMKGQSMLLTFTKIGKEVFPEATIAMLNMAQKFGSIEEASIQLGKALNDPIQGVTALRRVGVMLSDAQEQQIKDFMAVGDVASAQRVILQELETEFGGLAEAMGQTAAGQMAIFNNKLDTLKETLGSALIPSLIRFMDAVTPVIEAISSAPPWVQDLILGFLGLVALAGPLITFAGMITSFVGTLSGMGITFASVGTAIATVGTFITATLIPAIVALLPVLALIAAVALLVYMVWKNWDTLKVTLEQLGFILMHGIGYALKILVDKVKSGFNSIEKAIDGVIKFFDDIRNNVIMLYEDGSGALHNLAIAFGFPAEAAQNFLQKIYFIVGGFVKLFRGDALGAIRSFAAAFGIMTPTVNRVFQNIASAIAKVITWIRRLKTELLSIKLPKALTPGSPTPFEIGLKGINQQMGILASRSLPAMNAGFSAAPVGISQVGQGSNNGTYIDNRRISAGLSADALRVALDDKFEGLAGAL